MSKITYSTKSDINTTATPEVNKVTAANMNEIKNVVNNNDNLMGDVSTLSTASTDVVSAINAISKYSTTEQRIGTWVGGKPLYRKVFKFGAMPNTTNKDIPHNISNLGITVNCYGMAVRSSDSRALSIPDSTPGAEITCGVTNTNVYVTTYSDRSSFNDSHIIIEYTKTTD